MCVWGGACLQKQEFIRTYKEIDEGLVGREYMRGGGGGRINKRRGKCKSEEKGNLKEISKSKRE